MKTALIYGISGFVGHHMGRRLKDEGYWVRGVDIKKYEYGSTKDFCDEFILGDLRDINVVRDSLSPLDEFNFDEVYTFACLMGGATFVFTGENDAEIMHDSALINLNVCNVLKEKNFKGTLFYSSSACAYPQGLQESTYNQGLKESDAWPADPDSRYGLEKLFSEQLFLAYSKNHNINVRIARFHNIFGPEGTYKGGKEKAPAAMIRKALTAQEDKTGFKSFEVLGDGQQTRSFLYIDDCIDAVRLLMKSNFTDPINIGSEESISIKGLAQLAIEFTGERIYLNFKPDSNAIGVRGRNSDNTLIEKVLSWKPKYSLKQGMGITFSWIRQQYGI